MRPQVGQLVNNKYRLLRLIGDGGMGSVFEARHEVLGTSVALKFLHSELTRRPGLVQRFLQEARVVARIQSPHVVRVSDVDQTPEGNAFIVMEFIEGKSLQALYEDLYRSGKRLSYADAMDYAMQMLDGLEAAHASGIVHRDLKPDNVMITRGPKGASLLKILDFGIAKLKVEGEHMKGLTRPGVVMGTPEYMAPEQAFSADQVDARADIFAFGVMLFEMLAGRRPVGGDEPHQIAAQYLAGEVAKLTDLAPQVPAPLAEIVHKAMAAMAKDRWESVAELRRAIESYAEAARAAARPSTKPSDRPRAAVKADGEANPSGAAQVMAAVGAGAASEVDGGATEKVDGLPAMMLVGGGTAEGLGPSGASPHGDGASAGAPIVAPSPAAPSPAGNVTPTSASSPAVTPVPFSPVSPEGAPWATEPAEFDPLRPGVDVVGSGGVQYTSTEGFSPIGADVGAPAVGGTAIDPHVPSFVGTAPMTPAGGFVAPPPPAAGRRKKSGGLGWLLFLATMITGAVLGGVFLWDRLELGEGKDPEPIATAAPTPVDLGQGAAPPPATTTPPPPVTTTPPAPPPATTTPPPPATTPPRPPPTQPRPQPTTPPTQPPPPPTLPTIQWPPAPTVPTLPPLIPITPPAQPQPQPPPQPQPERPQPQPQPSMRPTIPWRPKLPGRADAPNTDTTKDRPVIKVLPRTDSSSRPAGSSRPRVLPR